MIQNMRIGGAASQYPPPQRRAAIAILPRAGACGWITPYYNLL